MTGAVTAAVAVALLNQRGQCTVTKLGTAQEAAAVTAAASVERKIESI